MKKILTQLFSFLLVASMGLPTARADVNFNLLNINQDQNKLQQAYSNAYGFTPAQVAPAMMAPANEVPTILQIAKSAATMPLTIWGLRKLGLGYMDILKMYTLGPSTLFSPQVPYEQFGPALGQAWTYQQQYGNAWPSTASLADPIITQLGAIQLFTHYLKIPYTRVLSVPSLDPLSFTHLVINPWQPIPGFIPPGQAMKMGLWMPPGQAKKIGLWEPPGQAKKHHGNYMVFEGDNDDDQGHGHGHGHGHGWKWKD